MCALDPGVKTVLSAVKAKCVKIEGGIDSGYNKTEISNFSVSSRELRSSRHMKEAHRKQMRLMRRSMVVIPEDLVLEGVVAPRKISIFQLNKKITGLYSNEIRGNPIPGVDGGEDQPGEVIKVNTGLTTVIENEWINQMVKVKVKYIWVTRKYQEKKTHRVASFKSFSEKQKTEADLLCRFIKKVGGPNETAIYFGDGSAKFFSRLRGHAPSIKGVGLIRILHKGGFSVYMVNEAYTSCR